jgi:hypothetical protein
MYAWSCLAFFLSIFLAKSEISHGILDAKVEIKIHAINLRLSEY